MEAKCWQAKAHTAIWEVGGCLRLFIRYSITKVGSQAKLACGFEIRKNKEPAGMDEGFGLCVFFKLKLCSWICTKALTVKPFMMQASDTSLKKKKEWDGERAFQKLHFSKEIKQRSCRNLKLQLRKNISNPIQLRLPYIPREKIKWKKNKQN